MLSEFAAHSKKKFPLNTSCWWVHLFCAYDLQCEVHIAGPVHHTRFPLPGFVHPKNGVEYCGAHRFDEPQNSEVLAHRRLAIFDVCRLDPEDEEHNQAVNTVII